MSNTGTKVTAQCGSGDQNFYLNPTLNLISVIASVQSSADQTVTITDSDGNEVFKASGSSSSGGTYTMIGNKQFAPSGDGNYKAVLTANAGIVATRGQAFVESDVYQAVVNFGTNDGGCKAGDHDFNDLVVQIIAMKKG
ncbi:MAG: hypothetical protein AAGG75_26625 [Bacteroidota bacterium]